MLSDDEFGQLLERLGPYVQAAAQAAQHRAADAIGTFAMAADILDVSEDGATATVSPADDPSSTHEVTRATSAVEGERGLLIMVPGHGAWIVGRIPVDPNDV